MLGFAAANLSVEVRFLDPSANPPAAACGDVIQSSFDDHVALTKLAQDCDVITYEFENVPVTALQQIHGLAPIYPPASALRYSQDRVEEKHLFQRLDIPLPPFHAVSSRADLDVAVDKLGLPLVLKTRRLGYDGKGQRIIRDLSELDAAWQQLDNDQLVAEKWVKFDYEISCIGVRRTDGETAIYPIGRNKHVDGILHTSCSPFENDELQQNASAHVTRLLEHLEYVGVIALELFVVGDQLLANEFAPRVHNSGHWSIEGSETSQFENHIRAILDLPLGATTARGHAGMINLIGEIPANAFEQDDGIVHDYGKEPRPDRKLGHITVIADDAARRDELVEKIDKSVIQST